LHAKGSHALFWQQAWYIEKMLRESICPQVAAIRAAAEYALLSEGLAAELCSIVTSIFSTSLQPASTHAPAAPAVVLGALNAGKQLLETFPGMQDTILGPMGSLACSAGEVTGVTLAFIKFPAAVYSIFKDRSCACNSMSVSHTHLTALSPQQ
jgi:hypothetical protein